MKAAPFRLARTISLLVIALGLSAPASADWAPNGNRVDPDPVNSSPRIVADPFAGLLVGLDLTSRKYTRVLPSGEVAAGWPVTATPGFTRTSSPAPDGIAGMYVATAAFDGPVVVHRFLEDGTPHPGWPADGIEICNAPGYKYADVGPDGAGGVYVVWADGRNTDPKIGGFPHELYGTRVLANGSIAPGWQAQGTLLAAAADSVTIQVGTPRPDGAGGMLEFIQHVYDFLGPNQRVENRLLHVASDGTTPPGWPYGGWTSPPQVAGFDYEPDGAGGTYVTWLQQQGGTYVSHLLRLLSSSGPAPGWPAEGIPGLDDPTHFQLIAPAPYGKPMAADGAGGVFVNVVIDTAGGFQFQVNRVVHFEGDGTRAADWPVEGRRLPLPTNLSPAPDYSYLDPVLLASDSRGGLFAAWGKTTPDQTGNAAMIGAIHLDHAGNTTMGWPQGGRPVCDTPGQRSSIRIAGDGIGGTYIAWSDRRPPDTGSSFVYASRLDAFDVTGVDPAKPVSSPLRATPNPFSESVDLSVTLARPGDVRLDVLDVTGRAVRRVASGWFPAGTHAFPWDGRSGGGGHAPPGLYFVRGSVDCQAVGVRIVRIQ